VARRRQHQGGTRLEPRRKALDRGRRHHGIAPGGDDQRRHPDLERRARLRQPVHQLEGGVDPADAGVADRKIARRGRQGSVAGIADGVRTQPVALERLGADRGVAAAGHEGLAEAEPVQHPRQPARPARILDHGDAEHRRDRHQPLHRQRLVPGGVEAECRAHRVRKDEIGGRQALLHLRHDQRQIALVMHQPADMPLALPACEALRTALPAPVEGQDMKAAPAQLGDRFAIALDELGSALHDQDGAPLPPHARAPARQAQARFVGGLAKPDLAVTGHRVVRLMEEFGLRHRRSGVTLLL